MPDTKQIDPQRLHTARAVWLSLLGALLIAAVLQFAAAAKVSSGADSLQLLKQADIAQRAGRTPDITAQDMRWLVEPGSLVSSGVLMDFGLAALEFAIVLLLLVLHRGRAIWVVIGLMFASFFGYALFRLQHDQPCGCFGTLWHPPDGLSLAIDAGAVILSLLILVIRRTPKAVLAGIIGLVIAATVAGYFYARATDPIVMSTNESEPDEPNPNTTSTPATSGDSVRTERETTDATLPPGERLLASSLLHDVRAITLDEPGLAIYVFLWSPECSTCQAMKPSIDFLQEQYEQEQNPVLRIHSIQKRAISTRTDIEEHDWDSSPVVLIVQDGSLLATYGGEGSPLPNEVFDALMSGQPLEELAP